MARAPVCTRLVRRRKRRREKKKRPTFVCFYLEEGRLSQLALESLTANNHLQPFTTKNKKIKKTITTKYGWIEQIAKK